MISDLTSFSETWLGLLKKKLSIVGLHVRSDNFLAVNLFSSEFSDFSPFQKCPTKNKIRSHFKNINVLVQNLPEL